MKQDIQDKPLNFKRSIRDFPKDFPDENGTYGHVCLECRNYFVGHKRRFQCRVCETKNAIRRWCAENGAVFWAAAGVLLAMYLSGKG